MQHILGIALLIVSATPIMAHPQGPVVEVRKDKQTDETLVSVRAENASFRELLGVVAFELSASTGRTIELVGLDRIARNPRVDAFLIDRPWRDALRWLAGSAGLAVTLKASSIEVSEALPSFADPRELLVRSLLTYRQILSDHPEIENAPDLHMAMGAISMQLGPEFYTSAQESYETLIEEHPQSEQLWNAMTQSARVYGLLGEWEQAAVRYHEVADSPATHDFHVTARRALAEALCEIGERASNPLVKEDNGNKAVLTLQALDRYYPTDAPGERRRRAMLMGRSLALTADPVQALRALDVAADLSPFGASDVEVLALRAKALTATGRHGDAATAWLAVSRQVNGAQMEDALWNAAQSALLGGHELAVLAIHRRANEQGFGHRLDSAALEAKLRLGIDTEVEGFSLGQQLKRALEMVRLKQDASALLALRPIYVRRAELTPAQRLDLALGLAKTLQREDLPVEAIETLRVMVAETDSAMDKRQMYTLAAQIHEDRGDFESAIQALRGNL